MFGSNIHTELLHQDESKCLLLDVSGCYGDMLWEIYKLKKMLSMNEQEKWNRHQ